MTKLYTLFYILCFSVLHAVNCYAQNELYNNSGIIFMNTGSASATPTLFVNGNLVNQNGAFTNSGSFLELKGNIANNPTTYNVYFYRY
jgi:hypothetical protein